MSEPQPQPQPEPSTLAHHLTHVAASADDLVQLLNLPHPEGGIHPEALAASEHLATSLRDVVHALTHHEHLTMSSDDVWKALTLKHTGSDDGTIT